MQNALAAPGNTMPGMLLASPMRSHDQVKRNHQSFKRNHHRCQQQKIDPLSRRALHLRQRKACHRIKRDVQHHHRQSDIGGVRQHPAHLKVTAAEDLSERRQLHMVWPPLQRQLEPLCLRNQRTAPPSSRAEIQRPEFRTSGAGAYAVVRDRLVRGHRFSPPMRFISTVARRMIARRTNRTALDSPIRRREIRPGMRAGRWIAWNWRVRLASKHTSVQRRETRRWWPARSTRPASAAATAR